MELRSDVIGHTGNGWRRDGRVEGWYGWNSWIADVDWVGRFAFGGLVLSLFEKEIRFKMNSTKRIIFAYV